MLPCEQRAAPFSLNQCKNYLIAILWRNWEIFEDKGPKPFQDYHANCVPIEEFR